MRSTLFNNFKELPVLKLICGILAVLECGIDVLNAFILLVKFDIMDEYSYKKLHWYLTSTKEEFLHHCNIIAWVWHETIFSNMFFRYSSPLKRMSKVLMARRRGRRRRRSPTSRRPRSERIVRSKATSNKAVISVQRYLPPWRNTKKCSSLLGYIPHNLLPA